MRSIPILAATAAAALVFTACGGSDSGGATGSTAPAAADATVTSKDVGGVGHVLVDPAGQALYAADAGATGGKVLCVGACTSIWRPLAAGSALPSGTDGVGTLGVVTRPDGSKQVTAAGRPLSTFTQERSGQVTGNGLADAFGGQSFTWHAVLEGGTTAGGSGASPPAYSY